MTKSAIVQKKRDSGLPERTFYCEVEGKPTPHAQVSRSKEWETWKCLTDQCPGNKQYRTG